MPCAPNSCDPLAGCWGRQGDEYLTNALGAAVLHIKIYPVRFTSLTFLGYFFVSVAVR